MEIQKLKKEIMQDVRNTILLLILLIFLINCNAQEKLLQGKYKLEDQIATASEHGTEYFFSKDLNFTQINYSHLGREKTYKGTYSILKNTLTLKYEELIYRDSSYFKVINREKLKNLSNKNIDFFFITDIKVCDEINKPISGAILNLRNNRNEIIVSFISDKRGNFPELSINDSYINNFQISYLGKEAIAIDTKKLTGYSNNIKVTFSDSESIQEIIPNKNVSYVIEKSSKKELILYSEENKKIILKKE